MRQFLPRSDWPADAETAGIPIATNTIDRNRVDFICFDNVIAEIKALKTIGDLEPAQAINYLRASGLQRALVLNFGARSLQHRRVVVGLPETKDPRLRDRSK